MTDAPAIEFRNLSKIYRTGFWQKKHLALTDLHLDVPSGSIFGFLGANGAGKTTTIKILMGLQYATTGSIRVWGEDAGSRKVRARIGYLPERPVFHLELTGNEFLNFHRGLFGSLPRQRNAKSNNELLDLVGIPHVGDKMLREYSKGMLQRIGIAQALVSAPDLLILDEPMSGLDPVGRRDVRQLILDLSKSGKTIFFSSHILSDVESICDQLAFLEKGVLKAHGGLGEILQKAQKDVHKELYFRMEANAISASPLLNEASRFGNSWRVTVDTPERLREYIEHIWEQRGTIESVNNVQVNLEEALFPMKQ